ncbi:hypothetical protein [Anaerotruncus colihominis]|uniref:hypothetical protein n=2 Tax=Anaerotruncus colihominis TaxID=169435 RepID=UPI0013A645E3|nr:hypothetical protein [Anaerotruncus colihominis]
MMTEIVGTGNVVEKVLAIFYTEDELRELETADRNCLMDLVIEYGGIDVLEDTTRAILG